MRREDREAEDASGANRQRLAVPIRISKGVYLVTSNPAINPEDLEFAEAWRPNAGDSLIGTVSSIDTREGQFGPYPIVTVRTETGEFAFHAYHTVARGELAKFRPGIGDQIGIKYHGRDEAKGYERYRIVVRKANASDVVVDWAQIGNEAAAELGDDDEYINSVLADEDGAA